jgi:FkbM family methyltransferase
MMMKLFLKKCARLAGFEVRRYGINGAEAARRQALLDFHGIDLVLDVGANAGQYGNELREGGYRGRIVSFEPLMTPRQELCRLAGRDPSWLVAPQAAIGDHDGDIEINVAENSWSSSILPINETHVAAAPHSRYVGRERVPLARLDTLAPPYFGDDDCALLKIDTQGFEAQVLDGATAILPRIRGVQLELSFVPLYDGQALFMEMVTRLQGLGYELHALLAGFSDQVSGRMLQADGIFFRPLRAKLSVPLATPTLHAQAGGS